MTCRAVRRRLQPLLDGQVGPAEAGEIERHLTACPACRQEWEELARLEAALAAEPALVPPAHLRPAILARARTRTSRGRVPVWLEASTFAGVVLACASVAAVVEMVMGRPVTWHVLASPVGLALLALGGGGFGALYYRG